MRTMNLMLDLETLGTKPGAVVLSIAAVPFASQYDIEPFYQKIRVESSIAAGLTIDPATEKWWATQDMEVRREAHSGTLEIHVVLDMFSEYIRQLPEAPRIWGNGSDFDNPILAHAYSACGIRLPWSFRDNMCFRTLKGYFPGIPYVKPLLAHNALSDAKAQAAHANKILYWLQSKGALPPNA